MLEVLDDRYGSRATITTSQVAPERWHDLVGDPTTADAICGRLLHNAHRIHLKGPLEGRPPDPHPPARTTSLRSDLIPSSDHTSSPFPDPGVHDGPILAFTFTGIRTTTRWRELSGGEVIEAGDSRTARSGVVDGSVEHDQERFPHSVDRANEGPQCIEPGPVGIEGIFVRAEFADGRSRTYGASDARGKLARSARRTVESSICSAVVTVVLPRCVRRLTSMASTLGG